MVIMVLEIPFIMYEQLHFAVVFIAVYPEKENNLTCKFCSPLPSEQLVVFITSLGSAEKNKRNQFQLLVQINPNSISELKMYKNKYIKHLICV